ncbi:MAG: hypothetical protein AAFO82_00170 [Bacteroidota bacterium]
MSKYKALQISHEKHAVARLEAAKRGISIKKFIEDAIDKMAADNKETSKLEA